MRILLSFLLIMSASLCTAQPTLVNNEVHFQYRDAAAKTVSVAGDFNSWSRSDGAMKKSGEDLWTYARTLSPGVYQYMVVINDDKYVRDPANPASAENYNRSARNSVFAITYDGRLLLADSIPGGSGMTGDNFPIDPERKPVYLNIIWHQHQPLYVDPTKDQLQGPWVRTHATKDYYDMAALLRKYPKIHCTINLTSSLLLQLKEYYVDRLAPFIDVKKNSMDIAGFQKKWKGKTDPWIDLALKPAEKFTKSDKNFLYSNTWNAFGISEVMIDRFPEYAALNAKRNVDQMPGLELFTAQELREIKFWFFLAYFDPDFLLGPVKLPDGSVVNLSDYVSFGADGKFRLKKQITEADCRRMIVETYRVMANVIPIHKELRYDATTGKGQVEIITTPYYHPILPLIYDSDVARTCQPNDQLPTRFSYPEDAKAQVAKAVRFYTSIFGSAPSGMWPGEGSISQQALDVMRESGIRWTASDAKILARSEPPNQANTSPYRFYTPAAMPMGGAMMGGPRKENPPREIALVFRDTELSDRIGFKYQTYKGEEAADDFVRTILSRAPKSGEPDVLVTVILDGENAWEWYRQDMDGKEFLNALYRKLSLLADRKQVITTTTTEYMVGNSSRGVKAHPLEELPAIQKLWPGSWINGNFDTWVGEGEENRAWEYLLRTRQDLEKSGLKQPDPLMPAPRNGSKSWYAYKAWDEMYAAEGSDWFWWYGSDQTAPAGDKPFDDAFRVHLNNVYKNAQLAGAKIESPGFDPIIVENNPTGGGQGTMAQSQGDRQLVTFTCNASKENVKDAIYIVGNLAELGAWTPNAIRMRDDGREGDLKPKDGIWSIQIAIPVGEEVQYKFTNSGKRGEWVPGEEFSGNNRTFRVAAKSASVVIINNTFGKK
jgi:alpha-amylase/alpha-mannosidase (GH57 family)